MIQKEVVANRDLIPKWESQLVRQAKAQRRRTVLDRSAYNKSFYYSFMIVFLHMLFEIYFIIKTRFYTKVQVNICIS